MASLPTFADFYAREFSSATKLAYLLTGSRNMAEDIAQEAFIRVYPRFNEQLNNPAAYLHTTLINLCKSWHRSEARRRKHMPRLGLIDSCSTLEVSEMLDIIGQLPYRQRVVITLRYWVNMPDSEIAQVLKCRRGTVKSLASRAHKTIRGQIL